MSKASLLELAKKLNIPRRNCVKTKEELEEAIKDTITKYKEIIVGSDTPTCMVCLQELPKQQVIVSMCMIKVDGGYNEKTRMGETSKKYRDRW